MEQLSSRSSIWDPPIIRFHSQSKVATSPLLRPTKASVVTLVWILAQIQPVKFSTHDQWTASRHHRCIQHQWWCHCLWKDTRWSWQSTESCFPEICWYQPDPEQVKVWVQLCLSLDLFSPKMESRQTLIRFAQFTTWVLQSLCQKFEVSWARQLIVPSLFHHSATSPNPYGSWQRIMSNFDGFSSTRTHSKRSNRCWPVRLP